MAKNQNTKIFLFVVLSLPFIASAATAPLEEAQLHSSNFFTSNSSWLASSPISEGNDVKIFQFGPYVVDSTNEEYSLRIDMRSGETQKLSPKVNFGYYLGGDLGAWVNLGQPSLSQGLAVMDDSGTILDLYQRETGIQEFEFSSVAAIPGGNVLYYGNSTILSVIVPVNQYAMTVPYWKINGTVIDITPFENGEDYGFLFATPDDSYLVYTEGNTIGKTYLPLYEFAKNLKGHKLVQVYGKVFALGQQFEDGGNLSPILSVVNIDIAANKCTKASFNLPEDHQGDYFNMMSCNGGLYVFTQGYLWKFNADLSVAWSKKITSSQQITSVMAACVPTSPPKIVITFTTTSGPENYILLLDVTNLSTFGVGDTLIDVTDTANPVVTLTTNVVAPYEGNLHSIYQTDFMIIDKINPKLVAQPFKPLSPILGKKANPSRANLNFLKTLDESVQFPFSSQDLYPSQQSNEDTR